jgi:hypothetical protein
LTTGPTPRTPQKVRTPTRNLANSANSPETCPLAGNFRRVGRFPANSAVSGPPAPSWWRWRGSLSRRHREIAAASGNQVLQELLQSIRSLLRIWVDRALTDEGHAASALAEHREIFRALESRDEAAVTAAMRSHMDTASRRLLAGFDADQGSAGG